MTNGWVACLDELALRLRAQHAALETGRVDEIVAFQPPSALGPLPPHLAARAHALRAEADRLRASLAIATSACGRDLRLVTAFTAPVEAGASFIDISG